MIPRTSIKLNAPTNRTVEGPFLHKDKEELIVEYDVESDDGDVKWFRIRFLEPLHFEYRDISCCEPEDCGEPDSMRIYTESPILKSVLQRWEESVGWQEWQQKQGGANRFKHYILYFDDAASINVIARECLIE